MNNLDTDQKTNRTKLIIALGFIAIISAFFIFDGQQWLDLATIKQHREALLNYTEQNFLLAFIASGIIYTLATAFSLPGGAVLSLAIGFMFGRWKGTLLIVIFATLGATLVFWLARYLFADWAKQRLDSNPMATKIIAGFDNDVVSYMLFLRLVPIFPFWLVNLAPAFTSIPSQTYILTTLIGIIPGSFVFANLGKSLGSIDSLDQLLSLEVLLGLSLLGLLSLLPIVAKKYIPQNPE